MIEQNNTSTAMEETPGGSYIPTNSPEVPAPSAPPTPQKPAAQPDPFEEMSDAAIGHASEINDFDLTMRGIADGDPLGMETFDLGFFADGTPLIRINGANVPIRHEQWMALLSSRNAARKELAARMDFAVATQRAGQAVRKVTTAIPGLPAGLPEMLFAQSQIDPESSMTNLSRLYQEMMKDNGQSMVGDVGADLQKWRNDKAIGFMLRKGSERKETRPNPAGPNLPPIEVTVPGMAKRDERVDALRQSRNPSDSITLLAYEKLEDFALDPNIRKMFPGLRIGIFDRITKFEQDQFSSTSLFSRLQHLAAYNNGDFGSTVPIQHAGVVVPTAGGQVNNAAAIAQYRAYLEQLDMFGTSLGYDLSSKESLDAMALQMVGIATQSAQQAVQPAQPQQPAQQPSQQQPQAPRTRPRATR